MNRPAALSRDGMVQALAELPFVSDTTPLPGEPRAAYLHVPFCRHRCGYCDFTLVAGRDDLIDAYLAAMRSQLASVPAETEVDTLFIGGGTPTHLPAAALRDLLEAARRAFRLVGPREFSIEANPLDITPEKIAVLADFEVNRVSLGAQSFAPHVLRGLERDHTPTDILSAVATARRRIENVAIDLIFGVPGQSLTDWQDTLAQTLAVDVPHISTYGLTFERGTRFYARRLRGELAQSPEELEREMYAYALDTLPGHGLSQYEISNFARPGYACRHNATYWAGRSYYGFGPGAARYLAGVRETNHRSLFTWLKRLHAGASPISDREQLAPEDRAREALVLGLRRRCGVDRQAFGTQTGFPLEQLAEPMLTRHITRGLIEEIGPYIRLTRTGLFLADAVVADYL